LRSGSLVVKPKKSHHELKTVSTHQTPDDGQTVFHAEELFDGLTLAENSTAELNVNKSQKHSSLS